MAEDNWTFPQARRFAKSGTMEYVDDFTRERSATMRDPEGRAALEIACRETEVAGRAQGGLQCCGTTSEWHRPWCESEPRHYRTPL